MAPLTHSFFTTSLLLLSFLLLASASDYSYSTKSYVDNSKSEDKPELGDDGYIPKPYVEKSKSEDNEYSSKSYVDKSKQKDEGYGYGSKPDAVKPKPEDKPKSEDYSYNPNPTTYKPKPEDKEKPLPIRIEGLVLCKSGSKHYPIPGAVAKITCRVVDEHGQETTPCSLYSTATDDKGYFVANLPRSILTNDLNKLTECRAFLDNSPLKTCTIPTDVNKGITGALLGSYRILEDRIKLYWVGPFFFSEDKSIPGGY